MAPAKTQIHVVDNLRHTATGLIILSHTIVGLAFALSVCVTRGADRPAGVPENYMLVYEQSFNRPDALKDFVMTDPTAWKISPAEKGQDSSSPSNLALELAQQSRYQPLVRSPVNIALLANLALKDFILEIDLKQTGREYGHRDMCLFFGSQNPTNFYYVHLATKADDHAHNVFIVKEAPRTKIAHKTTEGVQWGLEIWHRVRLERRASEGLVKVYFDDMTTPVMEATDTSFQWGYVGLGSFDDTGMADNLSIWAPAIRREPASYYRRTEDRGLKTED